MVPEVVEPEFLIGRVRNVCGVRLLPLRFRHVRLDESHAQSQKTVNLRALKTRRYITDELSSKIHVTDGKDTTKRKINEWRFLRWCLRDLINSGGGT